MKGKYITLNIWLACLSAKPCIKKDIHAQLQETIDELKRTMQQLDEFMNQSRKAA